MDCAEILKTIKELLKQNPREMTSLVLGIIQCVLAFIACILAWFIPKRIMWEQNYSTLGNEYRTYDFAVAIQNIIEFFVITCKSDVEKIAYEYKKRFLKDMYGDSFAGLVSFDDETILEKLRNEKSLEIGNCDVEKTLHYNKRILTQYFHELALCAKSPFIGKRRVQKDFTSSEAKIMKILFLMNKAVDDSDLLYKDISCEFRMPGANRGKGMCKDLAYLYSILKRSGRFMDIK